MFSALVCSMFVPVCQKLLPACGVNVNTSGHIFNIPIQQFSCNHKNTRNVWSYCVFIIFEVMFIYFLFPETTEHSIEELAFCLYLILVSTIIY